MKKKRRKKLLEIKNSVFSRFTFQAEYNDKNNVCIDGQTMTFAFLVKKFKNKQLRQRKKNSKRYTP